MKSIRQTVESTMAAIAFTDIAEFRLAMEMAGLKSGADDYSFANTLERDLMGITFAEAGCFNWAAGL